MSELTDFLLARIAEDEAVARAVPPLAEWESPEYGWRFSTNESDHSYEDTLFVTRFNPARVLAECEAKRRIVEDCRASDSMLGDAVLRLLAQPYAEYPNFRKEWLV